MARYDEDLHENQFFNTLVSKYNVLFSEAAEKKWMIFVPRADTVSRLKLNKTDFENHILHQNGGEMSTNLISSNGKVCVINGDMLTTEQGYKEQRSVRILFEESFYNSRDESYQVFCLDQPLEGALTDDAGAVIKMDTLEDCSNYLWKDPVNDKVKRSVDNLLDFFQMEQGGSLRASMDAVSAVYTRAVQEVLKSRRYQVASQRSFCKLAVETYVMSSLHKKTFKEICFLVAHKDSMLNKITRNLTDIPPEYLGIKAQFRLSIPQAKKTLSHLNQLTSPLEKMNCLKQCVSVFTQMPLEGHFDALTADELLPILVHLIIISDIPNWHGNMAYINNFHFSRIGVEEFAYNVTSFEAAMEYVSTQSSQLVRMDHSLKVTSVRKLHSSSNVDETPPISQFFKAVSEGDVEEVSRLLKQAEEEAHAAKAQLCHPLCNCQKCTALEDKQMDDSHRMTVFSRDVDGRTALHIAARIGNTDLVNLLLEQGAIVTATDHNGSTPLHLACQKGQQSTVLLLLGEEEALINTADIRGNTCLHFACSNGHEECVKALIFHHKDQCEINAVNAQGDTPLHNAARWGYANIVSLLLEHRASTTLQNCRTETPAQCAQSRKVQDLLFQARKKSDSEAGRSVGMKMKRLQPKKRADSQLDTERHLKKLFRAIKDDDANYVRYMFGWSEDVNPPEQLCHPLCQCEECTRLRKTTALGSNLTVNTSDHSGHTPTHKAAVLGRRKIMELLLTHGATFNSRTVEQLTPLHLACQYNHKDVVLLLIEIGAEVNPQDVQGNTPLHFASQNGHMESTTLLLIHGADVTVANNRGDTPLHSAAKWNRPMIVHSLLLYGAQYSARNYSHQTPLQLTNDEEVVQHIVHAMNGVIAVGSYKPSPVVQKAGRTHGDSLAPPSTRTQQPATRRVEAVRQQQKHTELANLLRAIESFDRSKALRPTETDDRSAPVIPASESLIPPAPSTPPVHLPMPPSSPIHPPMPPSPPVSSPPHTPSDTNQIHFISTHSELGTHQSVIN